MGSVVKQADGTTPAGATADCALGTGGAAFASNVAAGNAIIVKYRAAASSPSNLTPPTITNPGTAGIGTPVLMAYLDDTATGFVEFYYYLIPITSTGTAPLKFTHASTFINFDLHGVEITGQGTFVSGEYATAARYSTGFGGADTESSGNVPTGGGNLSSSAGLGIGFSYTTNQNGASAAGAGWAGLTALLSAWGTACSIVESKTIASNSAFAALFTPNAFVDDYVAAFFIPDPVGGGTLTAGSGSYSLSGQDAGLIAVRSLSSAQGAYALTGQAVALSSSASTYTLTADQGTYTLIGSDAYRDISMVADQGSYALTGQTSKLVRTAILAALYGTYAMIGNAASLLYSGEPPPADGGFGMYLRRRRR